MAMLGGALQGGGVTIAMLIAGRFVAGIAIGLLSATIPVYCVSIQRMASLQAMENLSADGLDSAYQSEIAHPKYRGLLAGMQQWMLGWGFVVAVSSLSEWPQMRFS